MKIKREDLEVAQNNLQLYEDFDYSKIEDYESEKDKKEQIEQELNVVETLNKKRSILSKAHDILSEVSQAHIPQGEFEKFDKIEDAVRLKRKESKASTCHRDD